MELGLSVLRRTGANVLYNAVHGHRGLVWTDGRNIFLSPLKVSGVALESVQAQRLGGLEDIHGLSWSCEFSGGWCYLCVAQQQKISIWKVEGMPQSNLKMKLVRKISKSPLPQGCLWNPNRELLCLITKDQSIIYYKHVDDKLKLVLPNLEEGKTLTCAAWSADGEKLVVATQGSVCSLWVYVWDKIDAKLKQYHSWSWTCPQLTGGIVRSAVAAADDLVLLTTELQLDQLARSSGMGDHDTSDHTLSPAERLLNLAGSKDGTGGSLVAGSSDSAASQLLLLSVLPQAALLQSSAVLKGMLVPDLLCYVSELHQVVVGSNSQSTLQVYSISFVSADGGSTRPKLLWDTDIVLPSNERPKGVCIAPVSPRSSILLMVGTFADAADVTFPPSGMDCKYNLRLSLMSLSPGPYIRPVAGQATAGTAPVGATPSWSEPLSLLQGDSVPKRPLVVELPSSSIEGDYASTVTASGTTSPLSLSSSSSMLLSASKSNAASGSGLIGSEGSSGNLQGLASARNSSASDIASMRFLDAGGDGSTNDVPSSGGSSPAVSHRHRDTDPDQASAETVVTTVSSGRGTIRSSTMSVLPGSVAAPVGTCSLQGALDVPSDIAELQQLLAAQAGQISSLRRRLDELAAQVEETSCITLNVYQEPESPDLVHLVFHGRQATTVTRTFLLDKGRLKLDTVKSVFGVSHLELLLDGLAVVLTSNIDGYVPLKFESGSIYHVSSVSGFSSEEVLAAVAAASSQAPAACRGDAGGLLGRSRDSNSDRPLPPAERTSVVMPTPSNGQAVASRSYGGTAAAAQIDAGEEPSPSDGKDALLLSTAATAADVALDLNSIASAAAGDNQDLATGVERPPRRRPKAPAPPLPAQPSSRASAPAVGVALDERATVVAAGLPAVAPPGAYINITAEL